MAETLQIVINAKDNASGPIGNVKSSLSGLGSMAGTVAKGAVLGFAAIGAGAAALGIKAIGAGSDVEEMMGKFNVVFGDSAPMAIAALDEFGAAVGRNKFELRGMAASVQDTFVPMGFARDEAANLSVELSKLAVDVASFNNSTDAEVMAAFQSAIVGNHETLRQFGVVITQATLDQELLNMGIAGGVKEATEAEKVQARLNLIMAGTSDAHGDAARTAGSWANTMRGLKSTLAETTAEIGTQLLPVLTPLLRNFASFAREHGPQMAQAIADIIPKIVDLAAKIQGWMETAAPYLEAAYAWLAEKIPAAVAAIKSVWDAFWPTASQAITDAWAAIGPALDSLYIIIVTLQGAFEALAGGDIENMTEYLYELGISFEQMQSITEFIESVQTAWAALVEFFEPTIQRLKDAIGPMIESFEPMAGKFDEFKEAAGRLFEALEPVIAIIAGALVGAFNLLLEIVAAVMPDLGTLIGNFVDVAITVIDTLAGVITGLVDLVSALLTGDWAGAWEAASGIVETLVDGIVSIVGSLYENIEIIIKDLVTAVVNWFGNLGIDIPAKMSALKATVAASFAEIGKVFNPMTWASIGNNLIKSLADAISRKANTYLREKAEGVANLLPNWVKKLLGIASPSRVFYEIGLNIIDGLIRGIEGRTPEAIEAMAGVLNGIASIFEGMANMANMPTMTDIVERVRAINEQLKLIVVVFTEFAAWSFNYGNVLPALADVASNVGSVVSALGNTVETLAAMADLTLVSDLAGRMRYIVEAMRQAVVAVASFKNDSTLQEAASQAGALSVVADAIATIAKAWEIVQKFEWASFDVTGVMRFLASFANQAAQALIWGQSWTPQITEDFEDFVNGIALVMRPISDMAKAWESIRDFQYANFDLNGVVRFLASFAGLATAALNWMRTWGNTSVWDGFEEWADGIITAVDTIADISKAWADVREFTGRQMDVGAVTRFLASFAGLATSALLDVSNWSQFQNISDKFSDFADAIKDAMGALNSVVSFVNNLGALEMANDLPAKFQRLRYDMADMLVELDKMRLAVQDYVTSDLIKFAQDVGVLADGLTGAVRLLASMEALGASGDAVGAMRQVGALIRAALTMLAAELTSISGETSQMIVNFSTAIGSLMNGLKSALELALAVPESWRRPDPAMWASFTTWVIAVFEEFSRWVGMTFPAGDENALAHLAITSAWAQALGNLMTALKTSLELAIAVPKEWGRPDAVVWSAFTAWVISVFEEFARWVGANFPATQESTDKLNIIGAWSTALGNLMTGLKSALELAIAVPKEWAAPDASIWAGFESWVMDVFSTFATWIQDNFSGPDSKAQAELVSAVAGAMGSLFSALGDALSLALAFPPDWTPPTNTSAFESFVMTMFTKFYDWINSTGTYAGKPIPFGKAGLDLVNAFGTAMGSLFGGMASALDVFKGLSSFLTPMDSQLDAFFAGVNKVMKDSYDFVKANMTSERLKLVTEFGNAMSALFSGMSSALSVFDTMYKAGSGFANWMAGAALTDSPFSRAMADFFLAITETLTRFKANVVNAVGTTWMPAATTFLGAVQQVFTVLGQALGLFKDIQSSGLPSTSALQNFVDAVINLFSRFATGIGIMPSQAGAAGSQTQSTLLAWQNSINQQAQGWYQTGYGFGGMLALGWRDSMNYQATNSNSFMLSSTYQVTEAIKTAIKKAFGIASPSKVMQEYGNFVGMGLAIGIDSSLPSVQNAADKLAAAMGLPQLDSAANYAPVYTVRVEGDISVGGQQIDSQTADSIANLIVKRYRLYA